MASTAAHSPEPNCCICIQLGDRVPATATVMSEALDYLACDEHARWITIGGFYAARRRAMFGPNPIGAV